MAEILVRAKDNTHPDSVKDQRGCYKRGMPVVVMPDGMRWSENERSDRFFIIKIPGISVEKVKKYIYPEVAPVPTPEGHFPRIRRRLWHISWDDLPQGAKDKLLANGELTIKAGTYNGPHDYTWQQVKSYFKRIRTGQPETEDL